MIQLAFMRKTNFINFRASGKSLTICLGLSKSGTVTRKKKRYFCGVIEQLPATQNISTALCSTVNAPTIQAPSLGSALTQSAKLFKDFFG